MLRGPLRRSTTCPSEAREGQRSINQNGNPLRDGLPFSSL